MESNLFEAKERILQLEKENRILLKEIENAKYNNNELKAALRRIREEITVLKEEVKSLKKPPYPYGTFISLSQEDDLVKVAVDGKIYEVNITSGNIKKEDLKQGQRVLLNSSYNIIGLRDDDSLGEVSRVIEILSEDRLIVKWRESEDRVVRLAEPLKNKKLRIGDCVRFDPNSQLVYEVLPKPEVEEVVLEEVPKISYSDIGGLTSQIEQIKDAIELPYIYGHLFQSFKLKPPKGILLYGPPGCGKTMIAKAVAHSLSLRITRFIKDNMEALQLYKKIAMENQCNAKIIELFDGLKLRIYEYQSIYENPVIEESDELYEKLDKSGILGNFIRRTEGHLSEPKLAVDLKVWYNLLIELKEKGYGACLDRKRIGEILERKRKKYFMQRAQISDEEYALQWLREYLINNNIDLENIDKELERLNEKLGTGVESYFLNIKGPELLNKYVGETEYRIREVFQRAKEKASFGLPVIAFFDEMESLFRIRGSGISSDIESTIVPQFLSEIDGIESIENVIIIGASNRQDLIDPAVLRAGRFDVKIKIDRPDEEAAIDIFSKYLTSDLPIHPDELKTTNGDREKAVADMIKKAAKEMYSTKSENRFLRVTYESREQEILYFKDFAAGAMIEAIVSRAKLSALKRQIMTGEKGIKIHDVLEAIRWEYKENEELPNTTNPDDWAKIAGRKGERIISIESMLPRKLEKRSKDYEEVSVKSRYL
jgi:ATP-dependent 26S proteasome regulatory subunit